MARGVSVEDREDHILEGCGGEDGKNVDKGTEARQAYFIFSLAGRRRTAN